MGATAERFPKITVITPSYNQANYIEETILSVLGQGYPNLEYIVMDGGSTDGTQSILKRYEDQLIWFSEHDRGQSDAINKGLRLGTGEVFAYLNSDDYYERGTLMKVGQFFAHHPQAAWLTGQCRIVDSLGGEIRQAIKWYKNFWLLFKSYPALLVVDFIAQPATFWRKKVLETVGFFDEEQHLVMDYDYSLRVGRQYKLWALHQPLAAFRVHNNSKSCTSVGVHFGDDLTVARRYATSSFLIKLHALHSALIVGTYWYLHNQIQSFNPIPATETTTHPKGNPNGFSEILPNEQN